MSPVDTTASKQVRNLSGRKMPSHDTHLNNLHLAEDITTVQPQALLPIPITPLMTINL